MVRQLSTKISKKALVLVVALLMLSGFISPQLDTTKANPTGPFSTLPTPIDTKKDFDIAIQSPLEGSTFATYNATVDFLVKINDMSINPASMMYTSYLDGKEIFDNPNYFSSLGPENHGVFILTGLSQGAHKLTIGVFMISEPPPNYERAGSYHNETVIFFVATQSTQAPTQSHDSFSSLAMIFSGVIAGVIIISIALLVIYRKQCLKRKEQPTQGT
jgi:hypothetical protein